MNTNQNHAADLSIAYLLLRLSLGIVIFLHGVVRLAGHYQQFVYSTLQSFATTPLPAGVVHFAALCIPPAEAVLGFFILNGLLTRLAVIGGALLMILLLIGKSMQQDWTRLQSSSSIRSCTSCCSRITAGTALLSIAFSGASKNECSL